jgi:hypothetical protein
MILLQETGFGSGSAYDQHHYELEVGRCFYLYRPDDHQRLVTVIAIHYDHIHHVIDIKLEDYYTKEIIFVSRSARGEFKCEWEIECHSTSKVDNVRFKRVRE